MLFLSVVSSKTSLRLGMPALVLFLGLGMLAGSDGLLGIEFADPAKARFLGIVSLNIILFSGGLDTDLGTVRPVLLRGLVLSTLGVLLTTVLLGLSVHWLMDFPLPVSMLLGAIVSSTDAAAVFSIFRSRSSGLKRNLRPLLEFESGSNDPMAYALMLACLQWIMEPGKPVWQMALMAIQGLALGAAIGYLMGKLCVWILNKINLDIDGMYPVLTLALLFFTGSFTELTGGNMFLAVYVAGLILGNSSFMHRRAIVRFYDGLSWLMQIVMFIALGLLVFPSKILPIMGVGLACSLLLMFLCRPLAVWLCLWMFKMRGVDRWYVSWVGLKGAVPVIFATYPMVAGIDHAEDIFHIVFFISITSVLLQGTTLFALAGRWNLIIPARIRKRLPFELELSDHFRSEMLELTVPDAFSLSGKSLVEIEFPKSALIVMIHRDGHYLTPKGSTTLEVGDTLILLADNKETVARVRMILGCSEIE
jgi:cell volume regulation protein A